MHICVITIYDEVSHPIEWVNADYKGGRYTVITSDYLNIDWINALWLMIKSVTKETIYIIWILSIA